MDIGQHIEGVLSGPQGPDVSAFFDVEGALLHGAVQSFADSLRHDMWRVVKAHQRAGHTVVLASSAPRRKVAPLARELAVEHVLTPWGPGAVEACACRLALDLAQAFGYADGDEDVPFLGALGRPAAVNPQPGLSAHAAAHGWPVLTVRSGAGRLDPTSALRTAAMYGSLVGAGAAGIAVGLLSGRRRQGIDAATSVFAHLASAVGDIEIRVDGERYLWSHRPAVFLINHQSSLLDLLVTTTVLRGGFTAVAKREAAAIPVIGTLLRLADFAFVDRADSAQARDALADAREHLRAGISVVVAPEGTRSSSPQVGPFKKGAFHLASQAGVPIVPIVIRNAGELMSRSARTARSGTIDVLVGEPVETTAWTKADLDRAVLDVRRLYVDALERWPEQGLAGRGKGG